jgi:hypothetical protein
MIVIKMIIHVNNNNNNNNNINNKLCFGYIKMHYIAQGGALTPLAVFSIFLMFSIQA